MELKKVTRQELSRYNGKNGNPAYIAYLERIYDVTDSFLWKEGRHQAVHTAGEDLTEALVNAPHGMDLFDRVKVIGELTD